MPPCESGPLLPVPPGGIIFTSSVYTPSGYPPPEGRRHDNRGLAGPARRYRGGRLGQLVFFYCGSGKRRPRKGGGAMSTTASPPERIEIPVQGMTCAACSARVQRVLEKTEGVEGASVNLMLHNATVTYDPRTTSPDRLVDTIRQTGYDAELPEPTQSAFEAQEAEDAAQAQEFRGLARKAMVSLLAAAVGMVISMPVMTAMAHGAGEVTDPFMRWSMRVIDPPLQAAMPWLYAMDHRVLLGVLLALTIGVMGWA